MTPDVPPNIHYEFTRSLAFAAVFDLWTAIGLPEDIAHDLRDPHDHTITYLIQEYPSLEPTLEGNPIDMIEHDLRAMRLMDFEPIEETFETVREFFDEEVEYPFELELTEVSR